MFNYVTIYSEKKTCQAQKTFIPEKVLACPGLPIFNQSSSSGGSPELLDWTKMDCVWGLSLNYLCGVFEIDVFYVVAGGGHISAVDDKAAGEFW